MWKFMSQACCTASNHSTLEAAAERPPQGRGQLGLQRALDKRGLGSEFWTSLGYGDQLSY